MTESDVPFTVTIKDDIPFIVMIVVICLSMIVCTAIDVMHNTEHTYWISDSKYDAIDEGIEMLVNGELDSLIVTHPNKPGIVGYIYFRGNE